MENKISITKPTLKAKILPRNLLRPSKKIILKSSVYKTSWEKLSSILTKNKMQKMKILEDKIKIFWSNVKISIILSEVWDKNHKHKVTRHSLTSFYRREIKSWKILRTNSICSVKIDQTSNRSLFWLRLKFHASRTKFLSGKSTAMKFRLSILTKIKELMNFLQRILISLAKSTCLSMIMKSSISFFQSKILKFKM